MILQGSTAYDRRTRDLSPLCPPHTLQHGVTLLVVHVAKAEPMNRKAHDIGGLIVGVGAVALTYPSAHPAEYLGAALGGVVGSRLPDWIEPASWPGHRALGHSWAAFGSVAVAANDLIGRGQTRCRAAAAEWERRALEADGLTRLGYQLLSWLAHALAGFLRGLQGGYVSHLALDATTPAGLPLLG